MRLGGALAGAARRDVAVATHGEGEHLLGGACIARKGRANELGCGARGSHGKAKGFGKRCPTLGGGGAAAPCRRGLPIVRHQDELLKRRCQVCADSAGGTSRDCGRKR